MSLPTLNEVIRTAVDAGLARVRKFLPARVLSYDKDTNTCSVQVLIDDVDTDGDGNRFVRPVPVLDGVPVAQLRGAGFSLVLHLAPGDEVELHFHDRSLDGLLTTGQGGATADARRHDIQDAVAWPTSFTAQPQATREDIPSIGSEVGDNPLRVYFRPEALCLGEPSPAYAVALAEKVQADLQTLKDAIQNAVVTASDGGATLKTNIIAALTDWPSSLGSGTVKVKG